jgi:hypothetical protein
MKKPITPLLSALRKMTVEEQHQFAKLSGTTRNYCYQIATCSRPSPRAKLTKGLADASVVMHVQTLGRTPKLTMEQIATMCPLPEPKNH